MPWSTGFDTPARGAHNAVLLGLVLLGGAARAAEPADGTAADDRGGRRHRRRVGCRAAQRSRQRIHIDADTLRLVGQTHIYETMVRVPGVWVSKGSEEEHLTAIRSPVYTGTGACGEFLYLENGVPIRPAGFCNINNLFEINSEQAARMEVLRGAGSALFGSNALHGAINVVTPTTRRTGARCLLEGGPDDYGAVRSSVSTIADEQLLRFDGMGVTTNGYRDATGHDEQKVTLTQLGPVAGWDVHTTFEWTNLNQETGGYVVGYKAYKDNQLRKSNPNPESYRDAWSLRFVSEWLRELDSGDELSITPYFRRSRDAVPAALPSGRTARAERPEQRRRANFAIRHARRARLAHRRRSRMGLRRSVRISGRSRQ